MELLKDFDFTLHDYPSKASIIVDALSRKPYSVLAFLMIREWRVLETLEDFDIHSVAFGEG